MSCRWSVLCRVLGVSVLGFYFPSKVKGVLLCERCFIILLAMFAIALSFKDLPLPCIPCILSISLLIMS